MYPTHAHRMMTPGACQGSPAGYATRGEPLPELHAAVLGACSSGCRLLDLADETSQRLRRTVHASEAREATEALFAGQLLRETTKLLHGQQHPAVVSTRAGLRAIGRS